MKTIAFGLTIALAYLAIPSDLHADGKFYVPRDTPPVDEPYQRAIVSFRNGEEILIVQPKFVGATKDFGWIVPVPSLPMMDYVTNDMANYLFDDFGRIAAPHVNYYGEIIIPILFGLAAVGLLTPLVHALGLFRSLGWNPSWRSVRMLTYASFILLVVSLFSAPLTGHLGAGNVALNRDVEVLASERVGIYETHVIRPVERKTGALIDWLTANGFHYSPDDVAVFQSYVDKDWLFVTAKIAVPREETAAGDGFLQTLMLRFATPVPVYPFALSATSEKPTTILLYVLSDRRMSHPLLTTEFAGKSHRIEFFVGNYKDLPDQICFVTFHPAYLTRMKGAISAAETREDLILTPDATGGDFRRSAWRW